MLCCGKKTDMAKRPVNKKRLRSLSKSLILPNKSIDSIKNILKKIPVMNGFDDYQLIILAGLFTSTNYEPNNFIACNNEVNKVFYIIEDGSVLLTENNGLKKILKKGDYFGEINLISSNNAVMKAITHVKCLELNRCVLKSINESTDKLLKQILVKSVLMNMKNVNSIQKYMDNLKFKKFKKGNEIVHQGDEWNKLSIIIDGTVVVSTDKDGILGELSTGKWFGKTITHKAKATVICKTDILLGIINIDNIIPYPPSISRNNRDMYRHKHISNIDQLNTLVIDDDKTCCKFIEKYLNMSNITNIHISTSGKDAAEYLRKYIENIQLIVIDYNLLDSNAIQILHVINDFCREKQLESIPKIVLISASDLPIPANDIAKTNNFRVIKKPIVNNDINFILSDKNLNKNISIPKNTMAYLNITNPIEIGNGSFAKCYKCDFNGKILAIKQSNYKSTDKRNNIYPQKMDILKNLYCEITILNKLKNPYIINIEQSIIGFDCSIILMEYSSRGDLFLYINNGLKNSQIKKILLQMCVAVQYLHSKDIIHRDIKPENILIGDDGNIKLTDFGFACYKKGKSICGTMDYIAPEILTSHNYSISVDYWAIGILLYEMYHKMTPFNNSTLGDYKTVNVIFSNDFPSEAQILYKSLTDFNSERRIKQFDYSLHNIKDYDFVNGINFKSILKGTCPVFEKI